MPEDPSHTHHRRPLRAAKAALVTNNHNSLSHAVNQWNSPNPINVKADTATTYADVDVSDYTSSSDSRAGWFDCSAGADDIKLNTHWMDGYNESQKHAVVTHEFGHSLKLGPRAGDRGDGPVPSLLQPEHEQQPAVVGHQLVSQRMGY
ncbi:hypothetical protein [Micromonospora globbae]|uniref:hypothetical protein n=1 Tax=Micromonospora globbae TaxID=1894969 RepID=UPI0034257EC5